MNIKTVEELDQVLALVAKHRISELTIGTTKILRHDHGDPYPVAKDYSPPNVGSSNQDYGADEDEELVAYLNGGN